MNMYLSEGPIFSDLILVKVINILSSTFHKNGDEATDEPRLHKSQRNKFFYVAVVRFSRLEKKILSRK